jgi:Rrf2 family transcriptional regulator, iron-sulfur cluster assembly transcription factor
MGAVLYYIYLACEYPNKGGDGVITKTGVHAIKAMAALGRVPKGEYAGAAEISSGINAPRNYLGKLMGKLSRAGLLEGQRGANGGFRLARSADEITLFDVLAPIEDLGSLERCILGRARCSDRGACALHAQWAKVRDQYIGFLNRTTLKSVMNDAGKNGG